MDPVGIFFFALIAILIISAIVVPQIERAKEKSNKQN